VPWHRSVDVSAGSLADAAAKEGRFDLVIDAVGGELTRRRRRL
jgi:hypothetical protein